MAPRTHPRLVYSGKRLLLLAATLLGLALLRLAGLGWLQAALGCSFVLLALESGLRLAFRRRLPHFERELLERLERGDEAELLSFLHRARWLHFAAPTPYFPGKLAVVYARLGHHRAAAEAYRTALEEAPARQHGPLHLGLADSLLASGAAEAAEQQYRLALATGRLPGRAAIALARLIAQRGGEAGEVESLIRLALEMEPERRLRRELIHLFAAMGRVSEAREQLARALAEASGGANEEPWLTEARTTIERAAMAPS
jgi:tetratricopeptide (TPR) repeat protein